MRRQRSGVVILYNIYDIANFITVKLLSICYCCYAGSSATVNAGREKKGSTYIIILLCSHFIIIVMQSFYYYCYAVILSLLLCSHFIIIVMQ